MSRLIIRTEKKDIPKLSRQGLFKQFKAYEDMDKEELIVLINCKRRECKVYTDEKNLQRIKTEIKLLEDLYTIKCNDILIELNKYRDENKDRFFDTELGAEANFILTRMGYKVPIYIEECIEISRYIDKGDILEDIRQTVALAVVKEILEFYGAEFNEKENFKLYNIDEKKFYNYYLSIHRWCEHNYWKK